jgi:hypothetical protein
MMWVIACSQMTMPSIYSDATMHLLYTVYGLLLVHRALSLPHAQLASAGSAAHSVTSIAELLSLLG